MSKQTLLIIILLMTFANGHASDISHFKKFEKMSYNELEKLMENPEGASLDELERFYDSGEKLLDRNGKEYLSFPFFSRIRLEVRLSDNNRVVEARFNHNGGLGDYSSTSLDLIAFIKNPESKKRKEAEIWFKNGYLHKIQSWYLMEQGLPSWFKEVNLRAN